MGEFQHLYFSLVSEATPLASITRLRRGIFRGYLRCRKVLNFHLSRHFLAEKYSFILKVCFCKIICNVIITIFQLLTLLSHNRKFVLISQNFHQHMPGTSSRNNLLPVSMRSLCGSFMSNFSERILDTNPGYQL